MKKPILAKILNDIDAQYHSRQSPNYHFVFEALKLDPYRSLIQDLASISDVNNLTDPNSEVCFHFLLENPEKSYSLSLSMVGRYACLIRLFGSEDTVIHFESKIVNSFEKTVLDLLHKHSTAVLSKDVLAHEILFALESGPPALTPIYCVLFSTEFNLEP